MQEPILIIPISFNPAADLFVQGEAEGILVDTKSFYTYDSYTVPRTYLEKSYVPFPDDVKEKELKESFRLENAKKLMAEVVKYLSKQ